MPAKSASTNQVVPDHQAVRFSVRGSSFSMLLRVTPTARVSRPKRTRKKHQIANPNATTGTVRVAFPVSGITMTMNINQRRRTAIQVRRTTTRKIRMMINGMNSSSKEPSPGRHPEDRRLHLHSGTERFATAQPSASATIAPNIQSK